MDSIIGLFIRNGHYITTKCGIFTCLFWYRYSFTNIIIRRHISIWPPFKLKANPPQRLRRAIDGIGIGSLLILIILFFTVNDDSDWIYNGGFYLISLVTLFVIASVVHPSTMIAKF